jgi:hypothetical protein
LPDPNWLAAMQACVMTNLWTDRSTVPDDFLPVVAAADDVDDLPGQSAEEALVRFRLLTIGQAAQTSQPD